MAVCGVGGMGTFHARTLASFPGVEVVAVADPHPPNRERVARELGCAAFDDPVDLVGTPELDGVVIASPDDTHAELAIAALAGRGRFVLCEKPLATSVHDARRVVDAELAAGRRSVQLGFMRDFDPTHLALAEAVAEIGAIHHVRAVHRNVGAAPRPLDLIVGQSMVHEIHSVRRLTGATITHVTAFGSHPVGDTFRHVLAVCRLDTGAHATIEFDDMGFAYEVSVEVLGADGDALTPVPTRSVTRHDGVVESRLGTDWFARFAEAYRAQDAAWVASIRAGAAVGPSTWDGLVAQAVVEAILEALATGTTIEVEPAGTNPFA